MEPNTVADIERVRLNFQGQRVLLVEDNLISQQLGRMLLAQRGIEVTVAADGAAALKALREASFDLVLMDIQMPGMTGYEVTETLRRNLRLNTLPVIAMTAHATEDVRQACLAAGMNDFVTKPIEPERLYALIDPCLRVSAPFADPCSDTRPAAVRLGELPGIDVNRGLYFSDGNVFLFMALLRDFERLHVFDSETLMSLIALRRMDEAHRLVHNLKGVAGSLGATEIQELCRVVEVKLPDRLEAGDLDALIHAHHRVLGGLAQLPDAAAGPGEAVDAGGAAWSGLVEEMRALLKQGNLRALDFISRCRGHLDGRHGELMEELEDRLVQYRFDAASESLERLDATMCGEQ